MKLQLADKEYMLERSTYSFMMFLSDFGGFNDGIAIFPAILMTLYNGKMYDAEKASVFPIKRKDAKGKKRSKKMQKKFKYAQTLQQEDIVSLSKESAMLVQFEAPSSWLRSLFCCKFLCRRDRKLHLQDRTNRYIEKQLDIRNLIKTHIDISILTRLLLNHQQLILFQNQNSRYVADHSSDDSE